MSVGGVEALNHRSHANGADFSSLGLREVHGLRIVDGNIRRDPHLVREINVDLRVDIADFGLFAVPYFNPAKHNSTFDFNGDGVIELVDFGQFANRYFTNLP